LICGVFLEIEVIDRLRSNAFNQIICEDLISIDIDLTYIYRMLKDVVFSLFYPFWNFTFEFLFQLNWNMNQPMDMGKSMRVFKDK